MAPLIQSRPDLVLPFRFGGRTVTYIRTDGIFSASLAAPFLAYIHLNTINALREKHVSTRLVRRPNWPVQAVQAKKLDSLRPLNKAEDPYIAAILIALAQEQRSQSRKVTCDDEVEAPTRPTNSRETETSSDGAALFEVLLPLRNKLLVF